MSLDWGRKPNDPNETPETQEKHANSTPSGVKRKKNKLNLEPGGAKQLC